MKRLLIAMLFLTACALPTEEDVGEAQQAFGVWYCCNGNEDVTGLPVLWCGFAESEAAAAGAAMMEWTFPEDDPTGGVVVDPDSVTCQPKPIVVVAEPTDDGWIWVPEQGPPLDTGDVDTTTFYQYYNCEVFCRHNVFHYGKYEYIKVWDALESSAEIQAKKRAERYRCKQPTWTVVGAICTKAGTGMIDP